MTFKCQELTQKLFAGEGTEECHRQSQETVVTDTQEHAPCCTNDDDDDQGKKHGYRLADLASFRTELRRVLLHPPA